MLLYQEACLRRNFVEITFVWPRPQALGNIEKLMSPCYNFSFTIVCVHTLILQYRWSESLKS
jgi:hypothetical protein